MQTIPASPQTKRQGGYTIIELSIALTIIGILIVAGLAGVNSLLVSSKANSQIEDSGRTLAKLQAFVSSTASTPSLNTNAGVGLGLFTGTRVTGSQPNQVVANAFGGSEIVSTNTDATTHNITANTGAIYTLTNIPKASCPDLITSLSTLADQVFINTVTPAPTSGSGITASSVSVKSSGGTPNLSTVGNECTKANLISLQFALKP